MAATLNTMVNFCQWANVWNRELQKTWSPECSGRFWPQATENELKSSWLSPHTFLGIILLAASSSKGTGWKSQCSPMTSFDFRERQSSVGAWNPRQYRWQFHGEGQITKWWHYGLLIIPYLVKDTSVYWALTMDADTQAFFSLSVCLSVYLSWGRVLIPTGLGFTM